MVFPKSRDGQAVREMLRSCRHFFAASWLLACLTACTSDEAAGPADRDGGEQDEGLDVPEMGALDGGDATDEAVVEDQVGSDLVDIDWLDTDLVLDDQFALVIPDGTMACTIGIGDVFTYHDHLGRIHFQPGAHLFERDLVEEEMDWISRIEIGPDRMEPEPEGPGRVTLSVEETARGQRYTYRYLQAFDLEGAPYAVTIDIPFELEGGEPVQAVLVLDESLLGQFDTTFSLLGHFGELEDPEHEWHLFATCLYTFYRTNVYHLTLESGATLDLEQRLIEPDPGMAATCPAVLVRASYHQDAESRQITDFFQLAYTAWHHNYFKYFLVVFDDPVEATWGFYLPWEGYEAPGAIHPLNSSMEPGEAWNIVGYELEGRMCGFE